MRNLNVRTPALRVDATGHPLGSVLRCTGELDLSSVEILKQAVMASIQAGLPTVEVDLSEIQYLDSEAIRALLEARDELARVEASLSVRVHARSARLFQRLGLDRILDVRSP